MTQSTNKKPGEDFAAGSLDSSVAESFAEEFTASWMVGPAAAATAELPSSTNSTAAPVSEAVPLTTPKSDAPFPDVAQVASPAPAASQGVTEKQPESTQPIELVSPQTPKPSHVQAPGADIRQAVSAIHDDEVYAVPKSGSKLLWIVGVAVVAVLGIVAFSVLGGDDEKAEAEKAAQVAEQERLANEAKATEDKVEAEKLAVAKAAEDKLAEDKLAEDKLAEAEKVAEAAAAETKTPEALAAEALAAQETENREAAEAQAAEAAKAETEAAKAEAEKLAAAEAAKKNVPMVRINIVALPKTASITVDGQPVENPYVAEVEKSFKRNAIVATQEGYRTATQSVRFDRTRKVNLRLSKVAKKRTFVRRKTMRRVKMVAGGFTSENPY